jgi:hypothetical protein
VVPSYSECCGVAFAGCDDSLHLWGGVGVRDRGLLRNIWHFGRSKLVARKPTKLFENVDAPRYTHTQVCK